MSDLNKLQTQKLPMVPKAGAALILSIIGCVIGIFAGIVLGAIGLYLSKQAQTVMNMNPDKYRGEKIIKAASIWGIVSIIQGIILTIIFILYIIFIFSLIFENPEILEYVRQNI
jgi:ABC-type amino acid transport system permease subunit